MNMKGILLTTLALCLMSVPTFAAGPNSFQCIRPDGGIVCSINAPSGDPSVICNRDCPDCNMTCVARQHVIRDGNRVIINPGSSRDTPRHESNARYVETPQFCQREYRNCMSECRNSPNNRSRFDMDACTSSCYSVKSGCGRRP